MRYWVSFAFFTVLGLAAPPTQGGEADCGSLVNAYGPFDYTNTAHRKEKLPIVDSAHFNSNVEMLIRGQTGSLTEDLDYTLRAFPNHHRALRSMAYYQLKVRRPEDARYRSAECYLDRAKRNSPKDAQVYLIRADYLHRRGDLNGALEEYRVAEKMRPGTAPDRDHNMGLLFFDMKDYAQALTYAKRAYAKKYPDETLREKLKSVNQWRE